MAAGKLRAVLGGAVDLLGDNFLGQMAKLRLGSGGYVYLYGLDRTIILHPKPSRVLQQDVPIGANRLFDAAIGGFEGTGETVTSYGLKVFSSFKRLQGKDWIVAANYPIAEAFAPLYTARRYLLAVLAAGTLISLAAAWLMMRHLTAPLLHVIERIGRMTREERERSPIQLRTGDEIGVLAEAFNRLLEETENRKRALQDNLLFHQVLLDTCRYRSMSRIPPASTSAATPPSRTSAAAGGRS